MPNRGLPRFRPGRKILHLLALGLATASCQSPADTAATASPPPVGHYEGGLAAAAGQPEARAALDIRHPSPGHYAAELTVPALPGLSFVADSVFFSNGQLRLTRPARPGQVLSLTLDGDFWRGTLAVDTAQAAAILVKRGAPTPTAYRVEEVPQTAGSGWLFTPADTGTQGPALVLLPDSAAAPAAALWADALAREGVIVLVLPVADSTSAAAETSRLQAALRLLRNTAGADTANVGVWAAGARAAAVVQAAAVPGAPRVAFIITQNVAVDPLTRAAFRELKARKLPLLGLQSGPGAAPRAAAQRTAAGGRGQAAVRVYRTAGLDLLVPGRLSASLAPGLPGEVMEWLRAK